MGKFVVASDDKGIEGVFWIQVCHFHAGIIISRNRDLFFYILYIFRQDELNVVVGPGQF